VMIDRVEGLDQWYQRIEVFGRGSAEHRTRLLGVRTKVPAYGPWGRRRRPSRS